MLGCSYLSLFLAYSCNTTRTSKACKSGLNTFYNDVNNIFSLNLITTLWLISGLQFEIYSQQNLLNTRSFLSARKSDKLKNRSIGPLTNKLINKDTRRVAPQIVFKGVAQRKFIIEIHIHCTLLRKNYTKKLV